MASSKKDRDGLFRRGEIYYCWIRGERVSTRCRSRGAAKAVRDKLERAAVDPVYRASHGATVGEFTAVTLEEVARRGRSKETLAYYTSKLGQLVRGLGEHTVLAALDATSVDNYIDQRRKEGAGQYTISKELGAWRHMLRIAKRRGSWAGDIDALFPIGFARGYAARRRALAWDEIPKLLGAFKDSPRLRAWVALAIACGGRESEVNRVERGDISPNRDIIQIRGTKTDLADDAIAIPSSFKWLIEEALEHGNPTFIGPLVGGWANSVRDLAAGCKRAGIPKVSSNDLRRSHATLLRASGTPLDLVARQLRHTDSTMVEKQYARLSAEQVSKLLHAHTPGGSADAADPATVSAVQPPGDLPTEIDLEARLAKADELWRTKVFPSRVSAMKAVFGELFTVHQTTIPESPAQTGDENPNVINGVSDEDRTRDHRSHMPEATSDTGSLAEENAWFTAVWAAAFMGEPASIRPNGGGL